jgi:hypothetical protein
MNACRLWRLAAFRATGLLAEQPEDSLELDGVQKWLDRSLKIEQNQI